MSIEAWIAALDAHFPIESDRGHFSLSFIPEEPDAYDPNDLRATMRVINWDVQDGERMLRDIKEQQVAMGRLEHFDMRERFDAYLLAWADVLRDCSPDAIEMCLPNDLVFAEVLDLVSARNAADFAQAFAAKSRLGRYMAQ